MRKITIAGGGLAGLALASALRRKGVPVNVLEAGRYPRHRVCGEFISGVSSETLEILGISQLFDDARRHRSLTWHEAGQLIHRDALPQPALGISRYILDERLRHHLEALGGEIIQGHRATPSTAEGQVWAAGKPPAKGPWIGLKAHVRALPMHADLEMHAGTNGYVGLARVEEDWVNVCGLFYLDKSIPAKHVEFLPAYLEKGGNPSLAAAISSREIRPGSFSAIAGFQLGRQAPRPGVLCLGDAESLIPPFTGNGMSMAFQSAESALAPLLQWSAGDTEWPATMETIRLALHRRFRRRLRTASIMHRVLLDSRGRSAIHALSAARILPFKPVLALLR